jgi:hypothetical protein
VKPQRKRLKIYSALSSIPKLLRKSQWATYSMLSNQKLFLKDLPTERKMVMEEILIKIFFRLKELLDNSKWMRK